VNGVNGADPAAQCAQLEARLERQQQLYQLGDWTRERYLQARKEVLAQLATLESRTPLAPDRGPEALARLGAYVRDVRTAWQDADKANRRLLVRTLFELRWVVGERIVAAKPAAQFAPFFRVLRHPDPAPIGGARAGLWISPSSGWAADTAAVAALAGELAREAVRADGAYDFRENNEAHDVNRHGLTLVTARVRTSGPDGRPLTNNHRAQQAGRAVMLFSF
jgi:hypothetical protein